MCDSITMVTEEFQMKTDHHRKKNVTAHYSTYAAIFLMFVLSCWIILLHNINKTELNHLSSPMNKIHSAIVPNGSSLRYHNHWHCSYRDQEPSPEEALEQRSLLDSIAWPEPPHVTLPPLRQTSDPVHSRFTITPAEKGREWHVGDQLEAVIQMFDFLGHPKHYGGDFIIARLHNPEFVAGVAGQVVDHLNGSYSAFFPLLWEGTAQVEVTLIHPSEAVTVLSRLTREQPDRVFFKSLFRSGSVSEITVCNICLPSNWQPLCNYTDLHTGEPWYCYKPKSLSCDKRINHMKCDFQKNIITKEEELLFQSGVNLKVQMRASGSDSVNVLHEKKDKPEVKSSRVRPGPVKVMPSGYYYQGVWRNLGGDVVRQFNDASAISQCLKDKLVYMYGDSTARQWFVYLNTALPELKEIDLHSHKIDGPYMAVDSTRNILLTYRCHGPPLRYSPVPVSDLRYVANEIDGLAGGINTVVVISVWAHFGPFPVEVYINRLKTIRKAVLRLLDRAPGTLVVIRSGTPRALDREPLYMSLHHSDWFSLQHDRVLRAMFKGLSVCLVDAWEMTVSHNLPHDVHPPLAIVKNMINVLLSYIC